MPEPLSAWKYLLWTPALPSTQHRQLWELFKQERSTYRRRLIWKDEGIRKLNLHWCADGMEGEFPQVLGDWLHISWAFCSCIQDCCVYVAFIFPNFWCVCVLKEERKGKETEKETFAYVWTNFSVSCESFFCYVLTVYLQRRSCRLPAAFVSSKVFPLSLPLSWWRDETTRSTPSSHTVEWKPRQAFHKFSVFYSWV